MKRLSIIHIFILLFFFLSALKVFADVVILKNGQVIKDVKVVEQGDTIYCESKTRTYYISKDSVESIIRTETPKKGNIQNWSNKIIRSFPPNVKKYVNTYPRLIIAGVAVILTIILVLAALYKLMTRIKLLAGEIKKRRQLIRDVRRLDETETAVLREFIIQGQNTLEMPVEDKTVAGLIHKGILEKIGSKGEYAVGGLIMPVLISPAAKKKMSPKMLGMPRVLNDENKKLLSESRPKFIKELASFYKKLERKRPDYW